jgi:hypothetical protein
MGRTATPMIAALATGLASAAAAAVLLAAPAAAAPPANTLAVGSALSGPARLQSANGRYGAQLRKDGTFVVVRHTARGAHPLWRTPAAGRGARVTLRGSGNLALTAAGRLVWSSGTAGSGASRLVLGNDGVLALRNQGGTVWSTTTGNACRREHRSGKRVVVDLSRQSARLCSGKNQVLTTPITSGATALGAGTPKGTWHLQAKVRNTTLFPAAGGAYPVDFWMPYNGAYGMHDSSWQTFPYGSPKYRTQGSHGCVHFPHAAIAWMFRWAPIGTTVQIRS